MKCLHYVDEIRLEAGGVVRAVLDLVSGLAEAGVEVTLLTGDDTDVPQEWREGHDGAPRTLRVDRSLSLLGRPTATRRLLDEEVSNADVVHLHTPWDTFNPAVAAMAKRHRKPYVVSMHGMLDDWCIALKGFKKSIYLNLIARKLLESATRLHFTAAGERDQSMRRLGSGSPTVLPLLLDLDKYTTAPTPEAARAAYPDLFGDTSTDLGARILYLGRIHPIKGLDVLIDAAGGLDSSIAPPTLVFAGPYEEGYRQELTKQAKRVGLEGRLTFLGMTHGEEKRSLYAACDLFVLPSHHENFGISLAEAMCSGTPVITNRSVNIWPEVERFGALIVEDEVESLTQGLQTALRDLEQLKQQARDNRGAVLEWLEPERITEQYVQMYREAIDEVA